MDIPSPLAGEGSETCQLAGWSQRERGLLPYDRAEPLSQLRLGGRAAKASHPSPARGEGISDYPAFATPTMAGRSRRSFSI